MTKRDTFKPDYALIEKLESELLVGRHEHPYGMSPEGLITEVRVEHERLHRESQDWGMPSLIEREAAAEAEARRRWPNYFPV
jgi:hypothetical protein